MLDSSFPLELCFQSASKSCQFYLQNKPRVHLLTTYTAITLAQDTGRLPCGPTSVSAHFILVSTQALVILSMPKSNHSTLFKALPCFQRKSQSL